MEKTNTLTMKPHSRASTIFFSGFVLVSLLDLASNLTGIEVLHNFCKPLILPFLIAYFLFSVQERKQPLVVLTSIGLTFSWLGDVALLFEDKDALFFILGLSSFFLAHLLYSVGFFKARNRGAKQLSTTEFLPFTILVGAYAGALVYLLWPGLGELKVPVIAYSGIISLMTISALYRENQTSGKSFRWGVIGASFFVLSDSILAYGKFIQPIPADGFWIMGTYIFAQFMIVKSFIAHIKEGKN